MISSELKTLPLEERITILASAIVEIIKHIKLLEEQIEEISKTKTSDRPT